VPTHPLWRPFKTVDLDEVDQLRVGDPPPRTITVVPYDPAWPGAFEAVAGRVRAALGGRVLALTHIGSTSVPGLAAKSVIDIDLTVADSADEAAYVPDLEAAGFVLRWRDPEWEEHRVLSAEAPMTNLHVISPGDREARRHLMFRDWLRTNTDDRQAYEALKLELGGREFTHSMDYNNHKAALVYDIYEKVFAADPEHEHDPQPRA